LHSVNLPSTGDKIPSVEGKLTYGNLPSVESKIHPTEGKLSEAELPSDNLPSVDCILPSTEG